MCVSACVGLERAYYMLVRSSKEGGRQCIHANLPLPPPAPSVQINSVREALVQATAALTSVQDKLSLEAVSPQRGVPFIPAKLSISQQDMLRHEKGSKG